MKKVVLSNRAYVKLTEEQFDEISKQTTYEVYKNGQLSTYPTIYRNSSRLGRDLYSFPISRLDILDSLKIDYTIIDKRVEVPVSIPKPSFILRADQQEVADQLTTDWAVVNGKPGYGKTIVALNQVYKLQQKTLIVCTTTTIRDMWVKEIKKWFNISPGIIGSGIFNIDSPIVVANIQTLSKKTLEIAKSFGFIVIDEMHHCVASTFNKVLENSHAKYRLGLSGTLKRRDGLHVMFKDFFGFNIFTPINKDTLKPVIHIYPLGITMGGTINTPWAERVDTVYSNTKYINTVEQLCKLYANLGHKVLFICDRVEVLQNNHESLNEYPDIVSTLFTGSTTDEEREKILGLIQNNEADIINATTSIFSEGVSQNNLSCVILGSMISGDNESLVEQIIGRVQRPADNKLNPIVVDLTVEGLTGMRQAAGRKAIYYNHGWKVIDMTEKHIQVLIAESKK